MTVVQGISNTGAEDVTTTYSGREYSQHEDGEATRGPSFMIPPQLAGADDGQVSLQRAPLRVYTPGPEEVEIDKRPEEVEQQKTEGLILDSHGLWFLECGRSGRVYEIEAQPLGRG
ncbi:hypothetical protein VTN00DRAFT_481 [Thermoascus crustaceus]|uniref:uncharacterized protein n=1 Tax=Thermoascus crustaceus TaxID=5088 RepID=UPI0037449926